MRRLSLVAALLTARPSDRLTAQVDPTGHWRTLETAHFDVHVRAEYRQLGDRVAAEAEAAYAEYARLLPAPKSRIDLIVADNVDEANGYAELYPRPRVVIYAIPPAGDIQLEAYDRWLRLVVTHELAHIFHLDLARGWWGAARSILGRAPFLFPNLYTTPWMREGLAVFYEARLTDAGRLESGYFRAVINAALDEAGGMPLDEASTSSPKWPSGLRAYTFGSRFFGAAAARAGDSVVARFALAAAKKPIPWLQLGASWRAAAGTGVGDEWTGALTHGRTGAQGATTGRTLLRSMRQAIPPRLAPDGRIVVAFDDGRDEPRLLALEAGGARRRVMARLDGPNGVAVAPDGAVVVGQLDFTDPYTLRSDLWRVAPDGGERRLTHGARLREPDVAADRTVVAVSVVPGGTELVLLSVLDDSGDPEKREPNTWGVIGPTEPGVEWASPRFNPVTGDVAAVRVTGGWHDIVVLDRSGNVRRRVTGDSVPDLMPAFSRDGRWLLWSREIDGVPQIVGTRVDGPADAPPVFARFTAEPYAAWGPAADADTLYYLSYHADGYHLVARALSPEPWAGPDTPGDGPISAPPPASVRAEHRYNPLGSVLPRYWIPLLFGETGGAWVGLLTSGADALSRHNYAATLAVGTGTLAGRVSGQLAYLYAGPGHALTDVSLYHSPQLYLAGTPGQVACCLPDDEAHLGVSLVRRRWRSQALVRFGGEYTSDDQAERAGGSVSASFAHTLGAPLAISTQDGVRLGTTLRYRKRVDADLSTTEFTARASFYRSQQTRRFARHVVALRAAYGSAAGNDPATFSVGGVSGGFVNLVPGVTVGGSRNFPVRGYASGTLSGERAAAGTIELREPLALIGRGLGLFPLGLDRLSAALFVDAGAAWSASYCASSGGAPPPGGPRCASHLASAGAELATDVVLAYDFTLRLRTGLAWGFGASSASQSWPALYVTVGSSF